MTILKKLLTVAGATALLTACSTTPESYVKDWAKLQCQAYEKCSKASFLDDYDDVQECREEYEEYIEDAEWIDDCDFDEDEAKKCLEAVRDYRNSCDYDDLDYDDCAEVFTDCKGGGGPGSYSSYSSSYSSYYY